MVDNGNKKDPQILRDKFNITYMQALYCINYSGNSIQACKKAGYKNASAVERMRRNKKVQECIAWVNRPSVRDSMLTKDGIIASFMDIATNATSNTDKLRALENISKIIGAYAPDKKLIGGHFSTESLDRYTDKELTEKIGQSLLMLEDLGIGIPVPEKPEEG